MKHILGYRCTICGKEFPYTELMTCPDCGEKGIVSKFCPNCGRFVHKGSWGLFYCAPPANAF